MDDRKATAEPERKLLFYDATKPKAVDVPTKHPWFDSDELKKPVQSDNELRQKLEQQKKNIEALRQRGDLKLPDDGYKLDLRLAKVMSELDALRPSTSVEKVPLEKKQLEMDRVNRPKVLEQMYAEGPVMHRLYGGAMSDTRYREARAATYDAVHRLHKAVTECPEETEESPDPSGLVIPLMQHQRQALTWILWREKQVPRGGILADDMGLGKTLTMIALILMKKQLRKEGKVEHDENLDRILSREDLTPSKATLVICPASLMHQWRSEIEKRVRPGRIKIELFHGPKQKRENIPYRLARFDVVLTTYGLVASEIGEHKVPDLDGSKETYDKKGNLLKAGKSSDSVLLRVAWDRIILDEAHTIKNHTTLTAKACCRIPAGSRWCLSGTPIHNDLMDFYSLLRFLRCAPFDEKKVWKEYIQDSKSKQSKERLCTLVKSLLLRRTKEQTSKTDGKPLIELTEKKFEIHKIDLTSPEKMIYDRMHKFSQRKVEDFVKNQEQKDRELVATLDIESFKEDGGIDKALAQQLEQEGGNLEDSLSEIVTHQASQIEDLFERTYASTKIKAVMDGVDSITNKNETGAMDKCVIVSQWTQLLDIVEYHLKARGVGITRIDGSVPPATRQERVDRFNKKNRGSAVMLLSLTAGGVGLNLVGGNHLFLVDLHWNPALEQQAFDRIYRMGQEKDVFVHKFVCNETIEQRILDIQEEKLQLARDVLQGGAIKNLSRLTLRDFKYLFNLEKDPREIAAAENRVLKPQQAYLPQQKCSSSGAFSSHVFH